MLYVVLLLAYTFYYSPLAAENITGCHKEKCYQNMNKTYTNATDLINQLNSTSSKAVYDLEEIKNDITEVKIIYNELVKRQNVLDDYVNKLNQANETIIKDQPTVTLMLEKLSNISQYQANATSIKNNAETYKQNLETSLNFSKNVSETCQQARSKYLEFKKILDEIEDKKKTYESLNSQTEKLNNYIEQIFNDTIKSRNTFDQLKLPQNLVKDFLFKAENNFNQTIANLKDNVNRLKKLLDASQKTWSEMLNSYEKSVAKKIKDLESDVQSMNKNLKDYEEAFTTSKKFSPTFNEESKKLVDDIRNKLEKAETDFKNIEFSKSEKEKLLKNYKDDEKNIADIKKKRTLIKVYTLNLEAILISDENGKIQEEIKKLKTMLNFVDQQIYLKKHLDQLRTYRDEILKVNCSVVNNAGENLTS